MGEGYRIAWCIALAVLAAPLHAQNSRAGGTNFTELAPSSAWVMDYADDSCALRRNFGPQDQQVILELRQFSPDDSFQVIVASSVLKPRPGRSRVKFEPDEQSIEPGVSMLGSYPSGIEALIYIDVFGPFRSSETDEKWTDAEIDARERAITGLHVAGSYSPPLLLQTGPMSQPMQAMRTCLDELLEHWDVDAEVQRTLSRKVAPTNRADWTSRITRSYPSDMLRAGNSGIVNIRLMIDMEGNPTSCAVQVEFSHPSFEKESCATLMEYARFEPALDAAGEPVASYFTTRVIYQAQ